MAKSTSGKWVSRVGASGGGKTYRKNRPINYYGVLAILTILGLMTVIYSRYEYQNPASEVPPVVGQTWYAAISGQVCGGVQPFVAKDPNALTAGFNMLDKNVLAISPRSPEQAGNNATFQKFLDEHPTLDVSANSLKWTDGKTYTNGDLCPAGTKYAGQAGRVQIAAWSTLTQPEPTLISDPASLKLTDQMQISVSFLPDNVQASTPDKATLASMVQLSNNAAGTTTTTVAP